MQGSTVVKIMLAMAVVLFISALALMVYRSEGATLNWQTGENDPVQGIYPDGTDLYVVTASNVSLVDDTGKLLWTVPFNGTQYSAIGNNGQLYVYSAGLGLNAISPAGNLSLVARQSMNRPPIVGPDGTLYLRSWTILSAISPSGATDWNMTNVISDPVVDGLGNTYFFVRPPENISDVYLDCIGPDGNTRWAIEYQDYYASTSLMTADSGVLVYDETMGTLDHIDEYGNTTWDHSMTYLGQYNLVQDNENRLYMFFLWGTALVLDENGNPISKFNPIITYDANLSYQPVAYNDTIYLAGDGKYPDSMMLYSLNVDGTLKWKQQLNGSTAPSIYAAGGIECFATEVSDDGRLMPVLYIISDTGNVMYTYRPDDASPWRQIYIAGDDTVYALTSDGQLYALKG